MPFENILFKETKHLLLCGWITHQITYYRAVEQFLKDNLLSKTTNTTEQIKDHQKTLMPTSYFFGPFYYYKIL